MKIVERLDDALTRIARQEEELHAWAHVDATGARRQAASSLPGQPLDGVLVGVKDIIDVGGLPCCLGSPIYRDRIAFADAALVARLKALGAIVLGKTTTTAFAYLEPAATRNPLDLARSPGGSSSGSAAAVAAGQVDVALATQTAGSIARPSAFCGIVGYKPTHGRFGLAGVASSAPTLDTVGWMTRNVETSLRLHLALGGDTPIGPAHSLGFCRTMHWDVAEPAMRNAFLRATAMLGASEVPSPPGTLETCHRTIMHFEMARDLSTDWLQHREAMSPPLHALLSQPAPSARDYREALSLRRRFDLDELFGTHEVLLTPSAPGEAVPYGSTGDPAFNRFVTLLGCPSVTLPFAHGPNGLPLGLQIIARPEQDPMLLATAGEVEARLGRERTL
ncbi:amidase [Lichenicoccus roseus]|uniref:Amidase n=1 Tax=Lichenicoccus roseus TaxID=2683649 RepID=A0A5R9JAW1_9PROT|nr:amidase [Lichenicoccus roseus]TLU71358.1 amidase [Lichenicoccus roseus]